MFTDFITKIKSDKLFNEKDILCALDYAVTAHKGQKRNSGQDFVIHPVSVASIVAEYLKDTSSIIASLLHDVVEDTDITLNEINEKFGGEVASLVEGVTKLNKITFRDSNQEKAENLRKFIISISKDIRILVIKLVDRLHNLRTIKYITNEDKQKSIALETLEIFVPLAERIGLVNIKDELEDLSFNILYPNIRDIILQRLENYKSSINIDIRLIELELKNILEEYPIKNFSLYGRIKRPYSIWSKMQKEELDFEEINDLVAFRIVVESIENCYQVLGIMHGKYKSFFSSFRDYISVSKDNGYQSIHTCILLKPALKVELQIQTKKMHEIAKKGLAAHWNYKSKVNPYDMRDYIWLNNILEIVNSPFLGSKEKYECYKLEMFNNEIFVFTPKGKIISLAKGSIVLDFAYAIHTYIGNTCIGAKINGKFVPPYHELENGCTVKVLTSSRQEPDISFINLVKTGCAVSNIRRYWRNKKKEKIERLIRNILDYTFKKEGLVYDDSIITKTLEKHHLSTLEFYYGLLQGSITINEIIKDFFPKHSLQSEKIDKYFNVIDKDLAKYSRIYLADCCLPVKGDEIVGVLSLGQAIIVHRTKCQALYMEKNKYLGNVDIKWAEVYNFPVSFLTNIAIESSNRPGVFFNITKVFHTKNINIIDFVTSSLSSNLKLVKINFEVPNINILNSVIKELEQQDYIKDVKRI